MSALTSFLQAARSHAIAPRSLALCAGRLAPLRQSHASFAAHGHATAAGSSLWRSHRLPAAARPPARAAASAASAAAADGPLEPPLRFIIYSKPGCCLCEALEEKLEALIDRAEFVPCGLTGATIEMRDITTNPEWEAAYSMTIPVLAATRADGGGAEVRVPPASPRFTADGLQRHLEKFLEKQRQQQE